MTDGSEQGGWRRSNSARKVPQAFRISRFSEPQVKRSFNLRERARTLHLAAPPLISKRPYVITVVRVFAVPSGPCGAAVSEAPLGLSPSSSPRGCAYCELFATPHAISHSALPDPDSDESLALESAGSMRLRQSSLCRSFSELTSISIVSTLFRT